MAMNGNDGNVFIIPPQSGYGRKYAWIIIALLVLTVLGSLAMPTFHRTFYRPIEVTRGSWQVLDPGNPDPLRFKAVRNLSTGWKSVLAPLGTDPLKFEVVREGTGPVVEPGDLIQISLRWSDKQQKMEGEDGWWLLIGFQMHEDSTNPRLIRAFIGQREGGALRFTESQKNSASAGSVFTIPFGNRNYAWNKGVENKEGLIYATDSSGYTVVNIKKIFKGQLKYRTICLHGANCKPPLYCDKKNTSHERWIDEMRFDGISVDGKRATFQYGPIDTPCKPPVGADNQKRFKEWIDNEWKSLPLSVQVE
jgi:hypothetical protein